MTTANKFTILRLILVIPFISLLSYVCITIDSSLNLFNYQNLKNSKQLQIFIAAGIIFIFAMITDYIDGYIARKTNTVTSFGKLFDPLADKFMISSSLIALSFLRIIPIYLVILMILRDILVDATRTISAANNKVIAANIWGKLKTVAQSISVILAFFLTPIWFKKNPEQLTFFIYNIPMYISTIFSLFSGAKYFYNIKKLIKLK
ncbi:MAG: CDP-diacylglycerol--glycerol-3-phosphate 3-phosphatidyltransferase [Mycoplasma sp.]|nr:CDP-diacylglycerol--glycerol-3-phosphate 3-phosphatidyltransferase [Mycoplasma sp.]